jgi:predicted TIM-barrel fold metal-dependent hydrolase
MLTATCSSHSLCGKLKYAEGRKGGFNPHADMYFDGIDAAFLYPSVGLFTGAVEDHQLAAAMCRAYNRWLADYCRPYTDRLFGVAMLPMQPVDLAIDEMRYARQQLGMRGGFLRPNPASLTSERLRPLVLSNSSMRLIFSAA